MTKEYTNICKQRRTRTRTKRQWQRGGRGRGRWVGNKKGIGAREEGGIIPFHK